MDQPIASNQPGSDTSNHTTTAAPLATTGATNINLYTQPEAKKNIILNAIAGAQQSIDLAVYFLTDKDVLASLIDAAKKVTVRVMLDMHGYIGQKVTIQQVHDELTQAGAQVQWSTAQLPGYAYLHEKVMVVDATTAYVTTSNFDTAGLGGGWWGANREYGVITCDPDDVRAACSIFAADWSGQPVDATMFAAPHLVVSPINAFSVITTLITNAQPNSTIQIAMEEFQYPDIVALLVAAAANNVTVQVLLPAGNNSIVTNNDQFLHTTNTNGIQIKKIGQPYMHAKIIIVDGLAFVGSQNLSKDSLLHNREMGILIADQVALATLKQTYQLDWNNVNAVPFAASQQNGQTL